MVGEVSDTEQSMVKEVRDGLSWSVWCGSHGRRLRHEDRGGQGTRFAPLTGAALTATVSHRERPAMRTTPHTCNSSQSSTLVRATVVNIKRGDPYDVYIGRPGRGQEGPWGNPFTIEEAGSRERCIELYRRRLWDEIRAGRITLEQLAALHGKRLGCFCAPEACHGDVLADAAAWAYAQLHGRAT